MILHTKLDALLLQLLEDCSTATTIHLAFSGGLDSSVLLHLLAANRDRLNVQLAAIHVHHGLQAQADAWGRHCESTCRALHIPLKQIELGLEVKAGESIEAQAREARYQALASAMGQGDLLLTAQHRDDQAETLLLQLLRGSGPAGLASMPRRSRFGPGWLVRPLLDISRAELQTYANAHQIDWVEDPSNQDLRFDRNFIRHQLMPLLRKRWPAASVTVARSARLSSELQQLGDELAAQDMQACQGLWSGTLSVAALQSLSAPRLRSLLRHWVKRQGGAMPGSRHLQRILDECLKCREDAQPIVHWADQEVRRFHGALFLGKPLPPHDPRQVIPWLDEKPLVLPAGIGQLRLEPAAQGVSAAQWHSARVEVHFRQGGERCLSAGFAHHRTLKNLLHDWLVPPWERDRLPLVYLDGRLAVIPGRLVCEPFLAAAGEAAVIPRWVAE